MPSVHLWLKKQSSFDEQVSGSFGGMGSTGFLGFFPFLGFFGPTARDGSCRSDASVVSRDMSWDKSLFVMVLESGCTSIVALDDTGVSRRRIMNFAVVRRRNMDIARTGSG